MNLADRFTFILNGLIVNQKNCLSIQVRAKLIVITILCQLEESQQCLH